MPELQPGDQIRNLSTGSIWQYLGSRRYMVVVRGAEVMGQNLVGSVYTSESKDNSTDAVWFQMGWELEDAFTAFVRATRRDHGLDTDKVIADQTQP
jgi:hypothetical protein